MNPRVRLGWLSLAAAASFGVAACQRTSTVASTTPPATPAAAIVASDTVPINTAALGPGSATARGVISESAPLAINSTGMPLTGFDRSFAIAAVEGGMFEIEAGKLALDKAKSPALKNFARKLVADHGAANDKLRQLASSHDLALPSTLPADKQKDLARLATLSGAAFDKQFIQVAGLKDKPADIALFEKASRDALSEDLREFAKAALPALREHLATAKKLPGRGGKSG